VHWIGPLVIGVYLGILIDPWLRRWWSSKEWERGVRGKPATEPSEGITEDAEWADDTWHVGSSDLIAAPLSDDRP
jgi:hypothetical protein